MDPAFATDTATARYYEQRAPEYDEWYENTGLYTARERAGWDGAVVELTALIESLPAARTLDVACGTGFLSRHIPGQVTGTDRSGSMLRIASQRIAGGRVLLGDAMDLPVAAGSFERVFTGHFYGHLPAPERSTFVRESRRVAPQLIVVDSALREEASPEQWQERILNDGSRHRVYKRYLTGRQLAGEIGGEVLLDGEWFVAAIRY